LFFPTQRPLNDRRFEGFPLRNPKVNVFPTPFCPHSCPRAGPIAKNSICPPPPLGVAVLLYLIFPLFFRSFSFFFDWLVPQRAFRSWPPHSSPHHFCVPPSGRPLGPSPSLYCSLPLSPGWFDFFLSFPLFSLWPSFLLKSFPQISESSLPLPG